MAGENTDRLVGRVTNWLLIAALGALPLFAGAFVFGTEPTSFDEIWGAATWYLANQWQENTFFIPTLIVNLFLGLAFVFVTLHARGKQRWAIDAGVSSQPREVTVVDEARLIQKIRAAIEPELTRPRPSIERVVNAMLALLVDTKGSNLYLKSNSMIADISVRIGMDQIPVSSMPLDLFENVVQRFCVILGINDYVGEGILDFRSSGSTNRIRVAISRGVEGVVVHLRLLDKGSVALSLDELGMSEQILQSFCAALSRAKGLILVNGPVGNGVTTTLYAAAHKIHKDREKLGLIAFLEHVIKQELPFVHQVELGAGRTVDAFLSLLSSGHQVIMVRHIEGEREARVVFEAAAKDHLVLASMDRDDAIEGIIRAVELSDGRTVSNALSFSLGQRLVRRLCPNCRVETSVDVRQRKQLAGIDFSGTFFAPTGCNNCKHTGFV
ncbi:MAG: ATPase, T2SS/T4P/T4SS family, partial [Pseudomonadota bacterium]